MNLQNVIYGALVLLAATLNFGFFIGDIAKPEVHNVYMLLAAMVVNVIVTVLKVTDRTHFGATYLATSLVASLQLLAAAIVWLLATEIVADGLTSETTAVVVSLSGGALFANVVSVVLLLVETTSFLRH